MKRRLERKYTFTPDEIRDIILASLERADIQVPKDVSTATFLMDIQGASVGWTDDDEMKVLT
jgi:hypothetical protein